jgi:hypothetical protein
VELLARPGGGTVSQAEFNLLPPPRLLPEAEMPPIIEPSIKGMGPFPEIVDMEVWDSVDSEPLDEQERLELVERARRLAYADPRLTSLLSGRRHVEIGVSFREDKEAGAGSLLFVLFDYTGNQAIEVQIDGSAERVLDIVEAHYQPPPTEQEIEEAIALAARDDRLRDRITHSMTGVAILAETVDQRSQRFGHRQLDVGFMCPDERTPRHRARVDLTDQTVVSVDDGCGDSSTGGDER